MKKPLSDIKNQRQKASLITDEEALDLLDELLPEQKLTDIQVLVFRYSWQGWTYSAIAEQVGYDTVYIREVGANLWKQLTQTLGQQISKKNVQSALRQQVLQKTSPKFVKCRNEVLCCKNFRLFFGLTDQSK